MKHLSSYKEVKEICNEYGIENWSINKDGLVDINGDVHLNFRKFKKLPLNFGKVGGEFDCGGNELTSLERAPKKVGGYFYCHNNKLTSLEGAPEEVGVSFDCGSNKLTSLEGAPKEVGSNFYCNNNKLISLEGAPEKINGNFYCYNNKLTSLEGSPREVIGDFHCHYNKLTSLEGIPFDIINLYCPTNPIYEIWKFIDDAKYLQEFVEVYDVVRPGKVVILEYLNDIRKLMGKELVKREEIPDEWEILDI